MAKTAKEKKKLKVPEFDEKTEKQLEQMAFLELRAKADPYVRDNPSARLALDLLERGIKIDGVGAGEILAGMRTGPEVLTPIRVKVFLDCCCRRKSTATREHQAFFHLQRWLT